MGSLPSLRSLELSTRVHFPKDKQYTLESLACLTQITELIAGANDGPDDNEDLTMEDMLHRVGDIRSLASLRLNLQWKEARRSPQPVDACMIHLNSLGSLSSLDLYTPEDFELFSLNSLTPELLGGLTFPSDRL